MREIKFRGFSISMKKWVYGFLWVVPGTNLYYILTGKINLPDCSIEKYEVYPESIGQYTGLKDKNGRKIYERDILTSSEYPFQDDGEYNYHAEVVYFDNCPCFGYIEHCVNPNKSGISNGMGESFEDNEQGFMFEIIGNIYENPELLEG